MVFPHLPDALSLTGKTALVTGAGSATGIGFASARALGQLGARVLITGTTDRIHDRVRELDCVSFRFRSWRC
jgi:3-oxoacyl-[acyl-carrier protein] reductase